MVFENINLKRKLQTLCSFLPLFLMGMNGLFLLESAFLNSAAAKEVSSDFDTEEESETLESQFDGESEDDSNEEKRGNSAKLTRRDEDTVEDTSASPEEGYQTSTLLGAPRFTYQRPRWAFQLGFAAQALGNIDIGQSTGGASTSSMVALGLEYQPRSWQEYGVLGFGVTGAVYPTRSRTTSEVLKRTYDAWSAGFNFRYQLRYWHEQLFVPFINYTYQRFYYDVINGPSGFTNIYGPSLGLQIYLNRFESAVASDAYVDAGILRSYLTVEGQKLSGEDEVFSLGGFSYVLGLRVEF